MSIKKSAKAVLRLEMKKKIAMISEESKRKQSQEIAQMLFNLPVYQKSTRVGVYLNMKDEVQTDLIVDHIMANGKECFIPWYSGDIMKLVKLKSIDDLKALPKTKWNIPQPLTVEDREDALSQGGLDLILIPGLAFTKQGYRLGRGKGYYDRFLHSMTLNNSDKEFTTIALTFKEQVIDDLPMEPTDFVIDHVLFGSDST